VRFERFSAYYEDPEGFGLSLEPAEMYRHTLPFSGMDLREFAYWFDDATPEAAYAENVAKWRKPLSDLVDEWRQRWRHPTTPPRLELDMGARGDEAMVVDTRGSEPLRYEVPRQVFRLLQRLELPLDRQQILEIGDQGEETEDALQWALTRGLIFAEGSHFLGLPVTPLRSTGRGLIGHEQLG
jgi:magnesium-protoporphyrin IX monomethyl ester (oxidative) cyclase